jgi:hypothetical protein
MHHRQHSRCAVRHVKVLGLSLGARRLRRRRALVASATEPRAASRPFGFDRMALERAGPILRCVIDAQDHQLLMPIADIDAINHEERHAWNADLVRALHEASVAESRSP